MKAIGRALKWLWVVILGLATLFLIIPTLLGIKTYAVQSGSMQPELKPGDMIYVASVKAEGIKVGDIITYTLEDRSTFVTHRVVEADLDEKTYLTKGDANRAADGKAVKYKNIQGVVRFSLPFAGNVLKLLTQSGVRILLVTSLLVILLVSLLIRINRTAKETEKPADFFSQSKMPPPGWGSGVIKTKKYQKKIHQVFFFISALTIAGSTLALLFTEITPTTNAFGMGEAAIGIPEITKPGENGIQWGTDTKQVKLKNEGSVPVVIRACIIPVFKKDEDYTGGNLGELKAPDGTDLQMGDFTLHFEEAFSGGVSNNWFFKDGYFYYRKILYGGETTEQNLLTGVTRTIQGTRGNYEEVQVEVEVMAECLQAFGTAPLEEWDVQVDDAGNVLW